MKLKKITAGITCSLITISALSASVFAGESAELTGNPWNDTSIIENLPETAPLAKDDFYTNVNFEWLKEKAGNDELGDITAATEEEGSMKVDIINLINDETYNSDLMNLIRLFYSQAVDLETLKEQGISAVQPYLDRIDSAASIEELNMVLTDSNFPFTPFTSVFFMPHGMDGKEILQINPNFIFVDDLDGAVDYREDVTDPEKWGSYLTNGEIFVIDAMSWLENADAIDEIELVAWEASYGKDCPYSTMLNTVEYGTAADHFSYMSLEEIQSLFGNYPITGVLAKDGRDTGELYVVQDKDWLASFAAVYNDENLELIKTAAKISILEEAAPYITNRSPLIQALEMIGMISADDEDPLYGGTREDAAYRSLSEAKALGFAVSSAYVNDVLGRDAVERIAAFCEDLRNEYKTVISDNTWLEEETKAAIIQKLDLMQFNIFEPCVGYYDYNDVKLLSYEEGGTLFGNYLILKQYAVEQENKMLNREANSFGPWGVYSPCISNAFYDTDANAISIYPGLINSYVYSKEMSDEELYGRIGFVIAHEMSHAFDYTGSQYDAYGNPASWFTGNDLEEYCALQEKLADYYSGITIMEGINADGEMLRGEAAADLTGLYALTALASGRDGFEYSVFFESVARVWATSRDLEYEKMYIAVDEHPLSYLRVNVNVQMMDEFYETFDVHEGDGMYISEAARIRIW